MELICSVTKTCRTHAQNHLVQKSNRHLLLNITSFECFTKVIERNLSLATLIGLHDCSFGNAQQLILTDICTDHHMQNIQEFITRNRLIVIQIVHFECNCNASEKDFMNERCAKYSLNQIKWKSTGLHFNFSSRLFSLLAELFRMGRKWASTCMNCRKFTRSSLVSAKNACTIRSHSGLMANSGIRRKSSRDNVPQSVRSNDVKREYNRSI